MLPTGHPHFVGHSLTGCSNEVGEGVHHRRVPRVKLLLLAAEEVVAEGNGRLAAEGAEMRAVIVAGDKLDAEPEAHQNHKCCTSNFEPQRVERNSVQPRAHVRMFEQQPTRGERTGVGMSASNGQATSLSVYF